MINLEIGKIFPCSNWRFGWMWHQFYSNEWYCIL